MIDSLPFLTFFDYEIHLAQTLKNTVDLISFELFYDFAKIVIEIDQGPRGRGVLYTGAQEN